MDAATGVAEGLPPGIYHNRGIESYMREVLSDPDRSNDFRELERELLITATDVDTAERIVLGQGEWEDVPISRAVAASTALPLVYEPYELRGRQLMDGGITSTTNIDVAVERRGQVHRRRQPAGALRQRLLEARSRRFSARACAASPTCGMPAVGNQAFRLMAHNRLHLRGRVLEPAFPRRRHHPDRARARRRADVRHLDPRLLGASADRQARLRVGDR